MEVMLVFLHDELLCEIDQFPIIKKLFNYIFLRIITFEVCWCKFIQEQNRVYTITFE